MHSNNIMENALKFELHKILNGHFKNGFLPLNSAFILFLLELKNGSEHYIHYII